MRNGLRVTVGRQAESDPEARPECVTTVTWTLAGPVVVAWDVEWVLTHDSEAS